MTIPDVPEAGNLPWLDRYTSTSGEIMIWAGISQSQLRNFAAEWERRCWPILAEAVGEVETLRAEVARLTKERDEARHDVAATLEQHRHACGSIARLEGDKAKLRQTIEAFPDANDAANLAHARAERDQLRADVAQLTAERDDAIRVAAERVLEARQAMTERDEAQQTLMEANATIVRAMEALGVDHPVWLILDDYDGSMDNVAALVTERDEAKAAAGRMRLARNEAQAQCRAFGPLVDAVLMFAEVEAQRTPAMENSSIWLEEHKARRATFLAAVDQMADHCPASKNGQCVSIYEGNDACRPGPCVHDQMTPSTPPSTPESDGQGEVAVTDAVEAPGGSEALYRCPACCRTAPWTDGRTVAAGDEADEFWCQKCGIEVPLSACTVVRDA